MNVNSIISNIFGTVGFNQSTFPIVLTTALKETKSGLYFNRDFHSLVTLKNIFAAQPERDISDANFLIYLDEIQKSAILRVCDKILQDKELLLENKVLYNYENIVSDVVENTTSFVGYEIEIQKRKNVKLALNRLIAEFNGAQTFNVYVFHSSKKEPIKTISITTVENSSVTNAVTDVVMSYDNYIGGKYYIGYLRSGLTVKAINRNWNNAELPNYGNNYSVRPFIVNGHNTATLFSLDSISYTNDTYGLNFDLSSFIDYTDVLIQNKMKLATAIGLQFSYNFMEQYTSSTMIGEHEEVVRNSILAEVSGEKKNGILALLNAEIENLREVFFYEPKMMIGTLR
jgi:hypothetical protein